MGLIKVEPFVAGQSAKSGLTLSVGVSRGRGSYRLSLTAAAQERHFGRLLSPAGDALALAVNNERKHHHLMGVRRVSPDQEGALPLIATRNGGVSIKVFAWRQVSEKRGAVSLLVVNPEVQSGGFSVKLPDWARPEVDART